MGRKFFFLAGLVCAFEAALFSCGGSTANIPDAMPPDDSSTASEDSGVTQQDVATEPDANTCVTGCSGDLHNVVDCMGNVVMTCTPDKACAPGGICKAACDAAREQKSSIG